MATSSDTLVRVYNKFLIDMVMDVKQENASFKKALKKVHKAIDPSSSSYIEHAVTTLPKDALLSIDLGDCLKDDRVLQFGPLQGIRVADAMDGLPDASHPWMRTYVYILAALTATYTEASGEGGDALVTSVLQVLSRVQVGEAGDALDGILDDDIVALLERVGEATSAARAAAGASGTPGVPGDMEDLLKSMDNSKIAGLAKEISTEIDLTKLTGSNPAELMNFANLGDSNSLLGSIVGKVGSKIQSKLASGELRHDELLSEAVSMLKMLDGNGAIASNPLIGNMLKAAQAGCNLGGGTAQVRSTRARDRLRAKLQSKSAPPAPAP
jgi:hypothetical protein